MFKFRQAADLKRRAEWLASQTFVVLSIQVPKHNEKKPDTMEQFFAALHGIYRNDPVIQEHVSFELVAHKDSIVFYIFTPIHLKDFIEGQLYAQYSDLQITQVSDYTKQIDLEGQHVAACKVQLNKEDVYPIKTYKDFAVDPLAGITAVLSNLEERDEVWLQMIVKPVGDEWQHRGTSYVAEVRKTGHLPENKAGTFMMQAGKFMVRVAKEIAQPGAGTGVETVSTEEPKLSAPQQEALKGIENKATKLGYETIFRLVAIASDSSAAKNRIQGVLAAFKQYNTTNLNGFIGGEIKIDDYPFWEKYLVREFEEKGSVMNIEEIASVYHFPAETVETSAISWAGSKKSEAPFNLPLKEQYSLKELTILGKTDFRNRSQEFGIKLDDRKRHIYVIGKSGTGKSTLLENMIIDDIKGGRGIILVDPHGELADKIVESVPEERINDVVIIDPADRDYPVSFNILEAVGDDFKGMVASGFVGIFKKIFGNSWGPRLEYILRNTVLALLDSEDPTMLGIPRMLTEPGFRERVVSQVKDTVIRDFWVNEFAAMDNKQRTEAISPILNKVGQFLSTSTIRNIVGQPHSTLDIRRIMDEQKILVVNLSKGKIGEDNMALLGAMIITKVQLAAMSRADVSVDKRPDCFLYVDEFQNFATESFASILSEARKYNLGLTIAHQYIAQMTEEVKDAVIGNVGTIITFRVGGPDAEVLVKEYAPVFDTTDLLNLPKHHIYLKLLIDGIAAPAFSAQTLPPRYIEKSYREQVVDHSRSLYSRTREQVETIIEETAGFKQKKEAEEAMKKAKEALEKGQAALTGGPSSQSAVSTNKPYFMGTTRQDQPRQQVLAPKPQPQDPVVEPVQQVKNTDINQAEEGRSAESVPKEIKPKELKVIKGWAYREVSQRGGSKWFVGEPEQEVKQRLQAKELERQEKLQAKGEGSAVVSENATVQDESVPQQEPIVVEQEKNLQPAPPPLASPAEQTANVPTPPKISTDPSIAPAGEVTLPKSSEINITEGQTITL